jgi:hypothetical protein
MRFSFAQARKICYSYGTVGRFGPTREVALKWAGDVSRKSSFGIEFAAVAGRTGVNDIANFCGKVEQVSISFMEKPTSHRKQASSGPKEGSPCGAGGGDVWWFVCCLLRDHLNQDAAV